MHTHPTRLCLAAAALVIAAAVGGCTGGTDRARDRRADHALRGVSERVALRGCVQPAPSGAGYTLQHVMVLPSAEQPDGQSAIDHPLIARGSWVRLAGGSDITADLKGHLNNEVTITGEIVEGSANTVGTAGHDAQGATPPKASVASGDAPSVAVERLSKIADNCAGE